MYNEAIQEALFNLSLGFKVKLKKGMEERGVQMAPMHFRAFRAITYHAPCTAQQMAEALKRDKSQITRLLNELVTEGWVERKPNPQDRRSQLLCVTAQGEAVLAMLKELEAKVTSQMMKGLSEAEVVQFISLANRISENLR